MEAAPAERMETLCLHPTPQSHPECAGDNGDKQEGGAGWRETCLTRSQCRLGHSPSSSWGDGDPGDQQLPVVWRGPLPAPSGTCCELLTIATAVIKPTATRPHEDVLPTSASSQPTVIVPTLQMKKLRPRIGKPLAPGSERGPRSLASQPSSGPPLPGVSLAHEEAPALSFPSPAPKLLPSWPGPGHLCPQGQGSPISSAAAPRFPQPRKLRGALQSRGGGGPQGSEPQG